MFIRGTNESKHGTDKNQLPNYIIIAFLTWTLNIEENIYKFHSVIYYHGNSMTSAHYKSVIRQSNKL